MNGVHRFRVITPGCQSRFDWWPPMRNHCCLAGARERTYIRTPHVMTCSYVDIRVLQWPDNAVVSHCRKHLRLSRAGSHHFRHQWHQWQSGFCKRRCRARHTFLQPVVAVHANFSAAEIAMPAIDTGTSGTRACQDFCKRRCTA